MIELGELMRLNFQYTQLVEHKAELALEISGAQLEKHVRGPQPEYWTAGETINQKLDRLRKEYNSICARIDQLKQYLHSKNYKLDALDLEASTVRG